MAKQIEGSNHILIRKRERKYEPEFKMKFGINNITHVITKISWEIIFLTNPCDFALFLRISEIVLFVVVIRKIAHVTLKYFL